MSKQAKEALCLTAYVDQVCDTFEAAWRAGQRPSLENFLAESLGRVHEELFRELLLGELECRRAVERPRRDEYLQRFPEQQQAIECAFSDFPEEDPPGSDVKTVAPGCSANLAAPPLSRCGDYELLEEVGRGAMGVVYKARDPRLDRTVALKMILAGDLAGEQAVQRFRVEAEAVARLDHPGIVPVFQVGEHDGRPYFAMGYVAGPSLAELLRTGPLPCRRAADLVREIADAVQYAHEQKVVHRDLKPSNILVDGNGRAKISDFGLAKRTDGTASLTAPGQVLGTPGYMPPEQARGGADEVGPAADVYSLGAVLYALLTGQPPFRGSTILETLEKVLEQDPTPPRLLNADTDVDLEAICLKCLEKAPGDRYASARALAEDLQRYLEGEQPSANRLRMFGRVVKALRHSKHDVEFRSWSSVILCYAPICLLASIASFILTFRGPPYPVNLFLMVHGLHYVALALVLWLLRGRWPVPGNLVQRQVWFHTAGFHIAINLILITALERTGPDQSLDVTALYPPWTLLSALMLVGLGGSLWGSYYALAAAFFAAALVMPLTPRWAPLELGGLWFLCHLLVGWRLRWLERVGRRGGST